jgi:hypothetical protein
MGLLIVKLIFYRFHLSLENDKLKIMEKGRSKKQMGRIGKRNPAE